jgi:hypothetical protein
MDGRAGGSLNLQVRESRHEAAQWKTGGVIIWATELSQQWWHP